MLKAIAVIAILLAVGIVGVLGFALTKRDNTATYTKGQRYWTQGQYRVPLLLAILGGRS